MDLKTAFRNDALEAMRTNSATSVAVLETLDEMNARRWPQNYVDLITQHGDRSYSIEDAWAFLRFLDYVSAGAMALSSIGVGRGPLPDREEEGNNEILSRLPHPFTGYFVGGPGEGDGEIEWSEPVVFHTLGSGIPKTCPERVRGAVLEAGSTRPHCTWFHLLRGETLARWPYGSERIVLMTLTREAQESLVSCLSRG